MKRAVFVLSGDVGDRLDHLPEEALYDLLLDFGVYVDSSCPRCCDFVNYRLAPVWVQRLRSAEREPQAAYIVLVATTRPLVQSGVRPTLALHSHPRQSELPCAARDVRRKRTDSV